MKIVSVYCNNVQLFIDLMKGTEFCPNASSDLNLILKSVSSYSTRDVAGLIVFCNPVTKGTLRLVSKFDEHFELDPKCIIFISDDANQLKSAGVLKTKYCPLYVVDSFDNTVCDTDLNRVMTTIAIRSDVVYDLSVLPDLSKGSGNKTSVWSDLEESESLKEVLQLIGGTGNESERIGGDT